MNMFNTQGSIGVNYYHQPTEVLNTAQEVNGLHSWVTSEYYPGFKSGKVWNFKTGTSCSSHHQHQTGIFPKMYKITKSQFNR